MKHKRGEVGAKIIHYFWKWKNFPRFKPLIPNLWVFKQWLQFHTFASKVHPSHWTSKSQNIIITTWSYYKSENTHIICLISAKVYTYTKHKRNNNDKFHHVDHILFPKQNLTEKNKTYPKLYKMERNPDWNVFLTIFRTTKTPQHNNRKF